LEDKEAFCNGLKSTFITTYVFFQRHIHAACFINSQKNFNRKKQHVFVSKSQTMAASVQILSQIKQITTAGEYTCNWQKSFHFIGNNFRTVSHL
jgi:hypothetical protein